MKPHIIFSALFGLVGFSTSALADVSNKVPTSVSGGTGTQLTAVDSNWKNAYHVWTMQWDDQNIRLYVDNHHAPWDVPYPMAQHVVSRELIFTQNPT